MNAHAQRVNCHRCKSAVIFLLIATAVIGGCNREHSSTSRSQRGLMPESPLRQYATASEFELGRIVSATKEPVLVEYGVDFNCARCAQMTPVMNDIAARFEGDARIIRASFNPSSAGQANLRLTLCPSYVFYQNGKLVGRCDGPTTYPVLNSMLTHLVSADVRTRVSDSTSLEPARVIP